MFWPFCKGIFSGEHYHPIAGRSVIVDERSAHQSYDTKGVQTLEY
jgi:hypothetical protein